MYMLIYTDRLSLRTFTSSDYKSMNRLLGSRAVMKSSVEGPLTASQIKEWLEKQINVYRADQGLGALAVIHKEYQILIGYCGLFRAPCMVGLNEIAIGYRFIQNHWGKGFATEASIAVREYAFITLGLPRLVALIEPSNPRSIRVAEKIGMTFEKEVMLETYDHPDYLYSLENPYK